MGQSVSKGQGDGGRVGVRKGQRKETGFRRGQRNGRRKGVGEASGVLGVESEVERRPSSQPLTSQHPEGFTLRCYTGDFRDASPCP